MQNSNEKESKTIIIAEAGVNHNGDINVAKKMIDSAIMAGADYIKFQTFKARTLVTKEALKAEYQIKNTGKNSSQYEMLKDLEFEEEEFIELYSYCKKKNIGFLSSPFCIDSFEFLEKLNLKLVKIPSGEITNYPLLKRISRTTNKIYISTGMSTIQEIKEALNILYSGNIKRKNITLLHCNSEYPTPYEDVNLKAISFLKKYFSVNVGYSDHTLGIEIPIAAVTQGATVIEKHFTLDKKMDGPDHLASLSPNELISMVRAIRNVEKSLYSKGIKHPTQSELKNINVVRKSIFIVKSLNKGDILTEENLKCLRPGGGVSPMKWESVIGKKVNKNIKKNTQFKWEFIE